MQDSGQVMVIDDEEIVCKRLREHLEKIGLEVETFTESVKAVARLGERSFNVVVTDLKMKSPDGLDVLHHVRRTSPATQVIIVTGYATIESEREAEYSGVFGFVSKPFRLDEVGSMVKKAAKKGQRLSRRASP